MNVALEHTEAPKREIRNFIFAWKNILMEFFSKYGKK